VGVAFFWSGSLAIPEYSSNIFARFLMMICNSRESFCAGFHGRPTIRQQFAKHLPLSETSAPDGQSSNSRKVSFMRNEELWNKVDDFLSEVLGTSDSVLESALRASAKAGLPAIQVSPNQGRLLQLLAQTQGARRILEMGTLGGYSTIWLARALPPEGCLISLELEASYAEVARKNVARANLENLVTIRVGPASETLAQLVSEKTAPFDFIFIDADKPGYPNYFKWAMKLSRPGTLIVADNVVRKGALLDSNSNDANVQGMRRLLDIIAAERRVSATGIQTVGSKGYDGFVLARVMA
jgi:predicted O-methyltransferase YrrM